MGDPTKQELIAKIADRWEEFEMGQEVFKKVRMEQFERIQDLYALRRKMDFQHDLAARRDEYLQAAIAATAEEKARADAADARADAADAATAEEKARADAAVDVSSEDKARADNMLISFVRYLAKSGQDLTNICEATGVDKEKIS
ncbi:MAG: hypothetical protein LBR53_09255 [Deltaproteobacteria bacterium]|nr:hypothetical protein [Deltaproteobacteria bacterium]